ncbi:hypothetical protein CCP2SC5_150031 [Azospirillaceae bacterium]
MGFEAHGTKLCPLTLLNKPLTLLNKNETGSRGRLDPVSFFCVFL